VTPPSLVLLASRYRLGAALGSGGMATVYDAVDERLERPVAVKVLRPALAGRADVRARFESEARSAAQLTHPNVVAVFDTGEADDGTPFLVMERLPGETLGDRLRAGAPDGVDVDWLLRVAGDVLGALGAAHAAGIVHRDVKPGNILIGTDGCAKVGDFGIAKSLEVAAAADLTSTNQLIGTPAYLAPERIAGRPATLQADLYALGVVLWEGLAGRKPFDGATPVATAYAIQHEDPPSLASLRPDLPPALVAAVERAMARAPEDRFATAAAMAAALGVGLAGVPAHPPVPAAAVDETVLSAPAVGASATQVLPAIEAVPVRSLAGDTATTPGRRAGFFEDRRRLFLLAAAGLLVALLLLALAASAGEEGTPASDSDPSATTTTVAPTTTAPPPPTTAAPAAVAPGEDGDDEDERPRKRKGGKGDRDD
jgi:eukaryotic-like serine/threonine-protein kinase